MCYALFPLPSLEGHSFWVSYQTHRQERTEKHIKCQAKPRPPVRHAGIVDEEVMDEVKNAVPNKGTEDDLDLDPRFNLNFNTAFATGPARPHGIAIK